MVPTRAGKRDSTFQSGKSQGILLRLEKSGIFTQDTGKIQKKLYLKSWGNLSASNSENPVNMVSWFTEIRPKSRRIWADWCFCLLEI